MQWEKHGFYGYWSSGQYTICTVAEVVGGEVRQSGCRVLCNRKQIDADGIPWGTLADAQWRAEQHAKLGA